MSRIPVQNVYYLLCYAWDSLDAGGLIDVSNIESPEIVDLLAHVLVEGTNLLFRRGVDRGYVTQNVELAGVRGQIDFNGSLSQMLFPQGRARCRVDEFTPDILPNQILKSTIRQLLGVSSINRNLRRKLRNSVTRMSDVSSPRITPDMFGRVRLHSNNRFYRFLLHVCELIFSNLIVDESTGDVRFQDFLRSEKKMPYLFERFVRNFVRREQDRYRVSRQSLSWSAVSDSDPGLQHLPKMETDVSLHKPDHLVIIDTKFYREALNGERVHSTNLYQLYAYLRASKNSGQYPARIDGMLLYPVNGYDVSLSYELEGHRLQIQTLDLSQAWQSISSSLKDIVHKLN